MTIKVKKILQSVYQNFNGSLSILTSIEARYPRIIHPEHIRHRVFSFSVSSSRAIPVEKMIADVETDPFIPSHWPKNQRGMQGYEMLTGTALQEAKDAWMYGLEHAIITAKRLAKSELHKGLANRPLEPYAHINLLVTGDKWDNFFKLRMGPTAELHFQDLATDLNNEYYNGMVHRTVEETITAFKDSVTDSTNQQKLKYNEWHMPYVDMALARQVNPENLISFAQRAVSSSARLSYRLNDKANAFDDESEARLYHQLKNEQHWSPFEHTALVSHESRQIENGNFDPPWAQLRKLIELKRRTFHNYKFGD